MFIDLFSNYDDAEAMGQVMDEAPELSLQEDTRGYSLDDLYAVGAAKQAVIDEHNLNLEYTDESILGGVYTNWKYNTGTGVLLNKAFEERQEIDPEFNLEVAQKSVEPVLLSKSNQETLSKAKNQKHFDILADNLRDYEDHKLNMEKLGAPLAFLTQGVAEFANVINYIPFLRAFGLTKLKKYTDVMKVAAFQGTANAAEEKLIDTAYNDRTASSYVAAFGLGAAFTGVVGSASKAINVKADARLKKAADNADAYGASKIKDKADEHIATAKHGAEVDRDYTNSGIYRNAQRELNPVMEKDMIDKGLNPDSELDIVVNSYDNKGLIPRADAVPQEKVGLAGFAQTLARSKNKATRYVNRVLFEHGEGNYGFHKEHTAALESELEYYRLMSGYSKSYIEAKGLFGNLIKDTGMKQAEFDRIMYRYIDGGHAKLDPRVTPEIKAVMDDFAKVHEMNWKEVGKHAQEAGVEEFQSGAWKAGKLHRKYNSQAFYDISQKAGDDGEGIKVMLEESINRAGGFSHGFEKQIKKMELKHKEELKLWEVKEKKLKSKAEEHRMSMKQGDDFTKKIQAEARLDKVIRKIEDLQNSKPKLKLPEFNVEQTTRKIAEALYNRMHNRSITNTADANLFSSNNRNLLMEALKDANMPKEALVHVKHVLDNQGRDLKADPFAKQIDMDMSVTRVINGEEISMLDLLDVDLAQGYASNQRYWIGRAALARKGDHFASELRISTTLNSGALKGKAAGLDSKQVLKELDIQQSGIRLILGQPLEQQTWGTGAMRRIRKLVASSSLGKLGIVQAGETGRMIGAVEASYRFPMIRDLVSSVITGKLNAASYKSIEDAVVGNIYNRNFLQHAEFRADDFGVKSKPFERTLDSLGYHLSKASGWNAIHKGQMSALTNTLSQMWYRQVMDGTMKRTQMNDLGIDDLLMADLKAEMTKHAKPTEGLSGKKTVMDLNAEDWNPGVRRKFGMMLHRKSTNAIQDINVGETPIWLNTEIGKFLGQFRTFSVAALSKQTTRDYKMLREGDMEAAVSMAFNTATSVMANVVKIGFVAATLPGDARDAYLEKALSPLSMANQILSYTGPLSPLMDASNVLGDAVFGDAYSNISGSKMGFRAKGLTGIVPGFAYVDKGFKGVSGITQGLLTDKNISKSDYKALYSTIPFSNNYMFEAVNNRVLTPVLFNNDK